MRNKNPVVYKHGHRKHKHHQYLTENTGIPHLDKHLTSLITLMRACDTWDQFDKLFKKSFGIPTQIEIEINDDDTVTFT